MILAAALLAFVPFNVQLDYPGDQEGKGVGITDFGCLAVATSPLDASGNSQVLMAAYDESGSLLWTDSIYWGDCSEALSIQPWSGGLILSGSWTQSSSGMNAVAMAVDGQGAEVWTYLLELSGTERFTAAVQGTDGNGDTLWTGTYGGPEFDYPWRGVQCGDSYYVAGNTLSFGAGSYDWLVLKLDSNGGVVWDAVFGGHGTDSNMALTTRDGLPVVAGMTEVTGSGFLGTVVIFDDQGEPLDQRVYDPGMIRSIELLPDGGFLMSGTGIGNAGDVAVRSVDADGSTPPLGIPDGAEPATPLRLLPNPASGSVTVMAPTSAGLVRVYDISGRLVAEARISGDVATLDVSRLPEGVYTVTLSNWAASRLIIVR